MELKSKQPGRLTALDVMRGITICGMILVNNAGACGYAYAPLRHASWDGFTPADLVFPAFMFIMGVSIYLSLAKRAFDPRRSLGRILRRTLLLVAVGIALKWVNTLISSGECQSLDNLRLLGVLQRLGICYGIVALLAVSVRHRLLPVLAAVLLVGYYVMQLLGNGFEKSADNIVSVVDFAVLGESHMYMGGRQFVDPEGVLSTIPAVAHVIIGFMCGRMLASAGGRTVERVARIAVAGALMLAAGWLWSYAEPLNKRLWSSSFVLTTCGASALMMATLIFFIDWRKRARWLAAFVAVGVNPLAIYVLSSVAGTLLRRAGATSLSFTHLWQPLFGDYGGSLAYALAFVAINWAVALLLYKRKIYIKL